MSQAVYVNVSNFLPQKAVNEMMSWLKHWNTPSFFTHLSIAKHFPLVVNCKNGYLLINTNWPDSYISIVWDEALLFKVSLIIAPTVHSNYHPSAHLIKPDIITCGLRWDI